MAKKASAKTAAKTEATERVFLFAGARLEDIAGKSAEEVRREYARVYPELTTCEVKGPVTENGVETFTFAPRVGAKG